MNEWMSARALDKIISELERRLSARRYAHVLGACHAAVRLATLWDVDPGEALVAALLHDIAKEETLERQLERITSENGELHPEYADHPPIWHALAGEIVAREEFGLLSSSVRRAIRLHPTGDGQMTPLEQIVFLADYTEPTRSWDGVETLRRLARSDLRAAADSAVAQKTDFVQKKGRSLHAASRRALAESRQRSSPQAAQTNRTAAADDSKNAAAGKERKQV